MAILEDEGSSDEGGEAARPHALNVDPLALSIAHEQAKADPKLTRASLDYLHKQTRMLDVQMEHLSEQRVAALKELKLRVLGQRLRVWLQIFTVLFATLIGVGLLVLIRGAVTSSSVVVEPFDAPPALAARGLTGKVVAGGLLDVLTRLQLATRAAAAKRNLKNAWAGDIKVEVPETGISIGEIDRLLHERFGHDVHIDGDLVQTETGGLRLSVRGDHVTPRTFSGEAGDLDRLTTAAAEYVYGQSEPVLYARYLNSTGRYADCETFLEEAFTRAAEADLPDLANLWGNNLTSVGRNADGMAKYRLAVQLKPRFWKAWSNLIGGASVVQSEEAALRIGRQMLAAAQNAPSAERLTPLNLVNMDALQQDWQGNFLDNIYDEKTHGTGGTQSQGVGATLADAAARMHDWPAAARYLTQADPSDPYTKAEVAFVAGLHALDDGVPTAAAASLQALDRRWIADPNLQYDDYDYPCYLGLAYGLSGRMGDAEAVFSRLSKKLSCLSFRADSLDRAGDWPGAQAAYAAAVSSGPDLPLPYQRWGLASRPRDRGCQLGN